MDIELESVDYYGNPNLLAQVWQNLIDNAVKFTGEGGRISIRLNRSASSVRVSVSDTGIGMSEEVKGHVFERFYQGDSSHSTQGNGLGLALAQRIVLLHGGSIEAESPLENPVLASATDGTSPAAGTDSGTQKGRGTTFLVTLPLKS